MSEAFHIRGGGVAGLTLASELSGRGVQVSVSDPGGPPGAQSCSWWAGGMLAPDCEGFSAEPDVIAKGREAANWWERQDVAVARKGTLVVSLARDRTELQTFARRVPNASWLCQDTLEALEPDVAERFSRALFLKDEAHIDPRRALTALHHRLECNGVEFIPPTDSPSARLVDCRGFAARDILDDLRGVKGEMAIIRSEQVSLSRPVRLLHPRFPLYIVPRGGGVFMLGATQIESSQRSSASLRSVLDLLGAAYALHPAFGEAEILEIGVDARPAFPDNQPRIRHLSACLSLNGLFRHGFLLAPSLARMSADLLLGNIIPEVWYEDRR